MSASLLLIEMLAIVAACMLLKRNFVSSCQDVTMEESPLQSIQYDKQLRCPPGFIYSTTLKECECYQDSKVECSESKASLYFVSCMTHQEGQRTFLGYCISFVPITFFYLTVLSFGISVTSAPMSSFVLYCQLAAHLFTCLLYTSPSPRDATLSRMPSSA